MDKKYTLSLILNHINSARELLLGARVENDGKENQSEKNLNS